MEVEVQLTCRNVLKNMPQSTNVKTEKQKIPNKNIKLFFQTSEQTVKSKENTCATISLASFFNEAFKFECSCNIQNRTFEIKLQTSITQSNSEVKTQNIMNKGNCF